VEVTLSNIGTSQMTGAAFSRGIVTTGPNRALTPVRNADGSGTGSVQLRLISSGSFIEGRRGAGGVRYLHVTFAVRSAQSNGTAYDTPRQNLTFLAASSASSLGGTAISRMERFDGTLITDPAVARELLPTGAVAQSPITGLVTPAGPDVLQVITEAEAASFTRPAGWDVFPYGFVVRNATSSSTRTLPASPAPDQFDGVVTFALKIPLAASAADDPYSINLAFLAVDDSEVRLTQSLEEQNPTGEAALQSRATALGATTITVLPGGGTFPASRLICSVRTAGTAAAPTHFLVNSCATGPVNVQLVRFDGGTGLVNLSSGIPLPPGWLQPSGVANVRLMVGGVEQPIYAEVLGTHSDGSVRSVLVQTQQVVGATPVAGTIVLGSPRTLPDLPKVPVSGEPSAAVLPTDPAYLISTDIVGPTLPVAQTRLLGTVYDTYETHFAVSSEAHWQACGAQWDCEYGNYYDRALIYYAWWARTGTAEYWRRANAQAYNYRTDYLESVNYGTSPHWSQLRGLERNYLLTGDVASRTAVVGVATNFVGLMGYIIGPERENRIQARVLESFLLAWRLGDTSQDWAADVDEALTRILSTQSPDGSYVSPLTCDASLNFMTGILDDVFISVYRYYRKDARIPPAIKAAADYLWTNEWVPSAQAFRYSGSDCEGQGLDPAPDLNLLIVDSFGFVYNQTGDATYRQKGELIFAGGVANAFVEGGKQFNENYNTSYLYTRLR
jgi:hypothetical protein